MGTYTVYRGESFFREGLPIYLNIATEGFREDTMKHAHDFVEIAYVNSGTGIHNIDGMEYGVEKGELCVISPGTPHVFCSIRGEAGRMLTVYNCIFRREILDQYTGQARYPLLENDLEALREFPERGKHYISIKLKPFEQAEIEGIYRKMHREYFSALRGYAVILRSCLEEMIAMIIRYADRGRQYGEGPEYAGEGTMAAAFEFLKCSFRSPDLSVKELAARTFLSRSYFCRLFSATAGCSFTRYLQNLRICEACRLLKTTDKKVTEIMLDVGMKDIKHFNRLFKDLTGKAPREFKRTDRENKSLTEG